MADETKALEAHLDAATALLSLTVGADWRASALANLDATMKAARFVAEFPLDDEAEPAPIFSPGDGR